MKKTYRELADEFILEGQEEVYPSKMLPLWRVGIRDFARHIDSLDQEEKPCDGKCEHRVGMEEATHFHQHSPQPKVCEHEWDDDEKCIYCGIRVGDKEVRSKPSPAFQEISLLDSKYSYTEQGKQDAIWDKLIELTKSVNVLVKRLT